ncbi:MAG: DUF4199 domain-containing protein [Wenzhouxiangella sp.]|jgi:NhaP-type Na+/H+ or K+/H+ antiporter|nr:DUF4199 domain-containing protein [Wenzhouxiangella sp.]
MNVPKLEIKWGLIFTAVALLWLVFENSMGWHGERIDQHATYTNFFAILAIAVFIFALLDKRRQLGGVMSWKQGFIAGAIISAVVAILSPLAQWLTHRVISPEYFPNAIAYAVANDKATQQEAEAYFNLGNYMLQGAIGGLVMGLVTAAIVAILLRKSSAA